MPPASTHDREVGALTPWGGPGRPFGAPLLPVLVLPVFRAKIRGVTEEPCPVRNAGRGLLVLSRPSREQRGEPALQE
ncbi:hypothetical protein FrEUN1fDRAFT_5381 [Parafrankia sp. EUN1f]|nr:hypothetical protein FrEUN1fDRAFT_5381 [Parafrankia sp. EUN1f]